MNVRNIESISQVNNQTQIESIHIASRQSKLNSTHNACELPSNIAKEHFQTLVYRDLN